MYSSSYLLFYLNRQRSQISSKQFLSTFKTLIDHSQTGTHTDGPNIDGRKIPLQLNIALPPIVLIQRPHQIGFRLVPVATYRNGKKTNISLFPYQPILFHRRNVGIIHEACYSMSCQLLPRVLSYLHIQKSRIQKCKQTDTIPKEFSGHFSILNKADLIMKARRIGILLQQLPIRIIDSGKDHRHLFH